MQKLLEVKDGQAIASGMKKSTPAVQPRLWADGSNILFANNGVEKMKGIANLGSVDHTVVTMSQAFVDEQQRAYLGTHDRLYVYANGVSTIVGTGFTGTRWSFVTWGAWLLATNDMDPVQVWKDAGSANALGNVPVGHARIIRKLAERPIIFYAQSAAWPAATDIENWTPGDPTTNAGDFFIRDLDSDIVAVEPLGEQLAFYTKNIMGFVSFIGGTSVYGFKPALEGIGAIGMNAVVAVGARHFGMGVNGFWFTDGSSYTYLDAPDVNRDFQARIDVSRGDEVVAVHVQQRTTVEWFFRTLSDTIAGYGYNYTNGAWSPLDIPVTAAISQDVFDKPLAATGMAWGLFDSTDDLSGSILTSSVTSGAFDAGQPANFKWWDMVEINVEMAGSVEVRFGLSYTEKFGDTGAIDGWGGDEWLAWNALARRNYIQREAPYITMQIRTTGLASSWRIGGLSVYGSIAGAI